MKKQEYKFVAYVSTYTMQNKDGITIFDVDLEKGTFITPIPGFFDEI